jgi:S-adenosylmethionine decarboxylase
MLNKKEIKFLHMLTNPPFEGSEKKIEISLKPGTRSFRSLTQTQIRQLVAAAHTKIVSSMKTESCDAYILSESSLFLFDDRLVMITCGTSNLIQSALQALEWFSVSDIQIFLFKRQMELQPWLQPTTFHEDAAKLSRIFPGKLLIQGEGEQQIFAFVYGVGKPSNRIGLEILLKGIRQDWYPGFQDPRFTVAEHHFTPSGYSMNAVAGTCEYFTIHLNFLKDGLNASFQGSFEADQIPDIISHVSEKFSATQTRIFLTTESPEITFKEISDWKNQTKSFWLANSLFETSI